MYKYNSIIPFGEACSTAILFNEMGIRKESLPFDWLAYQTPKVLLETFQDGFKKFFPSLDEIHSEFIRKKTLYDNVFREIDQQLLSSNRHFPNGAPPFCDLYNHEDVDRSNLLPVWEKHESDLKKFQINTLRDFCREFKFRNYSPTSSRTEFIFTNGYHAECMHDFLMSDIVNGEMSEAKYLEIYQTKSNRVDRLLENIKNDNFLGVHISDTIFLDGHDYNHFDDLVKLSTFFVKEFNVDNFTLVSFNLLPNFFIERNGLSHDNVINFYEDWDLYKDSNQKQRNFVKKILVEQFDIYNRI